MLIFSAFVPHSPILIPEVGKENLEKLKKTAEAYKNLESDLYSLKPDLLIIISSHANKRGGEFFTINQQPMLKVSFKDFGDLITNLEFENDIGFGYKIKESCEDHLPIILTADSQLDYGSGVPLFYLAQHLPQLKIISIGYADLSLNQHLNFGQIIRKQINLSAKRIAVVASGDLSHKLHQDSPAGFSPMAQEFDRQLLKLVNEKNIDALVNMDKDLIMEAGECGLRSLITLLGIIKEIDYQPQQLSYEAPFGIGYLVENFRVS
ncbi:MAG: AmmeMemoRadiSam system protein B [Patescibacteria group bacterium]|nr:AmmeMemoRadiSam system protein B [Patescibacteria group bacterium]